MPNIDGRTKTINIVKEKNYQTYAHNARKKEREEGEKAPKL